MTRFFDELEAQLNEAAHRRAHPAGSAPAGQSGRQPWWQAGLRSVPLLAAVGVVVAIALAAFLLRPMNHSPAPGGRTPSSGTSQNPFAQLPPHAQRELGYIRTATAPVLASTVCLVHQPTHVVYLHRAPSQALLSLLGVLRRPSGAADRLPVTDLVHTGEAYAGYSRRALTLRGTTYFIEAIRDDPRFVAPSSRCFALQRRALAAYLPHIPVSLRGPTRSLQDRLMSYDSSVIGTRPRDGLCLVDVHGNSSSSSCGETAALVRSGQTIQNAQGRVTGIIPDGVALVELQFSRPKGGQLMAMSVPVRNNMLAASVPRAARRLLLSEVIWRSAQGRVVKTLHSSSPAAAGPYCQHHVLACATLLIAGSSSSSGMSAGSGGSASSSSSSAGGG